jgi:hypothetical protein
MDQPTEELKRQKLEAEGTDANVAMEAPEDARLHQSPDAVVSPRRRKVRPPGDDRHATTGPVHLQQAMMRRSVSVELFHSWRAGVRRTAFRRSRRETQRLKYDRSLEPDA